MKSKIEYYENGNKEWSNVYENGKLKHETHYDENGQII